uniref:Ig-like domain-containing protein n=1 Tax=Electrophorus electricus TaxID=8005 RepID=A0A4W4E1J5_ELEEL
MVSLCPFTFSHLSIQPVYPTVNVLQGNPVTLSCLYNGSTSTDSLLWYRQYSRSSPQFVYLVGEAKFEQKAEPLVPGVSAVVNEKKNRSTTSRTSTELSITKATLTDSALYYCALRVVAQ